MLKVSSAYCINLDRRPDRWEQFSARRPACLPDIVRFPAIDGETVPIPRWHSAGAGAWGCYASHLALWRMALASGLDSVLIFEDDCIFSPHFARQWAAVCEAVPDDWGQVYLGGEHLFAWREKPEPVADCLTTGRNVNRTHAYAIHRNMMADLVEEFADAPELMPAAYGHIDHRLGQVHLSGRYKVYCAKPWICGQAAGTSDVHNNRRHAKPEMWFQ